MMISTLPFIEKIMIQQMYHNNRLFAQNRTNPYKEIIVDLTYIRKILGPEFRKKRDDIICTALRDILKKYDIILRSKSQDDGSIKMTMRQSL